MRGWILGTLGGLGLLTGGCEDAGGPGGASGDVAGADTSCADAVTPGADAVPASWRTCDQAADCVVLPTGCCDPCNGGGRVSVGTAHEDEAKAALAAPACACAGVACTAMGCAPHVPTCEGGVCGSAADPSWLGCSTLSQSECAEAPACKPLYGWLAAERCTTADPPSVYGGCVTRADLPAGCDDEVPASEGVVADVAGAGAAPAGGGYVAFPASTDACTPGWEHVVVEPCSPPSCAGLDEATCGGTAGCEAHFALPVDVYCNQGRAAVYGGCGPTQETCGAAETCAVQATTGDRLVFPTTCLPAGFTPCTEDPCAPLPVCAEGDPAPVGRLCVRGTPVADGEEITTDAPLQVQVMPEGCWSSSCTDVKQAACAVGAAGEALTVDATFCLAPTSDTACTPDCSGGGFANCASEQPVPSGAYTVTAGALSVSVTVPSKLPFGGVCAGTPF